MRRISIFVAVILLLAGCKGENSITGTSSSTRVLSGEVVPVGDLTGSAPAGISVTSSGQVAVTDGAGRFAFMGLPARNVTMAFFRADGINAQATVSGSEAAVVVQLQKSQAVIVSNGKSKRELEGLILAISPTSITVNDASTHGPVTAEIVSSTVIRKGNRSLQTTDLAVGDRVHVRATVNADGTLTALEIKLQEGGDDDDEPGQTRQLEGLILAVSSDSITVNNASTHGPVTAAITSATIIRKGNTRLTPADLKVNDRVHVKTTVNPDGTLTATEIKLQNPA